MALLFPIKAQVIPIKSNSQFTRTRLSPVVIRQLSLMVLWCLKNVGLVMSACLQFHFILQFRMFAVCCIDILSNMTPLHAY